MLRKSTIFCALLLLALVGGCQVEHFGGEKTGVAAGAAGVVPGVGAWMEQSDRFHLSRALESTPPYDTTKWTNTKTGIQYAVTPKPAYQTQNTGKTCRKAKILAERNGHTEETAVTACRENGRWILQP